MPAIKISTGAARILALICATPGMVETTDDLIRAGRVADRVQELIPTTTPEGVTAQELNAKVIEIEISEREKATLRKIVEVGAKKGMFGAGRQVTEVLNAAGVTADS